MENELSNKVAVPLAGVLLCDRANLSKIHRRSSKQPDVGVHDADAGAGRAATNCCGELVVEQLGYLVAPVVHLVLDVQHVHQSEKQNRNSDHAYPVRGT